MMSYPVSFVSLGPGDAELITLKSLRTLQQAEVIFCPSTTGRDGRTLSRAAGLLRELGINESIRLFHLPMSKDRREAMAVYREVFEQVVAAYQEEKRIAVAVEGDAGIYASIHYVLDELKEHQIPTEQLCGVPSFIAAGAIAQLQLISQEERLVVIPGTITSEELDSYLSSNHVPVIMKLSACKNIIRGYIGKHPEHTYHYFENVSTSNEYYSCHQAELIGKDYPYFSLMIIVR